MILFAFRGGANSVRFGNGTLEARDSGGGGGGGAGAGPGGTEHLTHSPPLSVYRDHMPSRRTFTK